MTSKPENVTGLPSGLPMTIPTVETCPAVRVANVTIPNVGGDTPDPERPTGCGLPGASLVMVSASVRLPMLPGVNMMSTVHEAPAASVNRGQFVPFGKSEPVKSPYPLKLSGALPLFVNVTVCAAEEVPINC